MDRPGMGLYVGRMICWMVAIPLVFLAVYPLVYLVLPESVAILADLPQDLTLVLILDAVMVPVVTSALFARDCRKRRPTIRTDG